MTREERNAKARERAAARRKTDAYRAWLQKTRDHRVKLKEKYRRAAGSVPREQITQRAAERANQLATDKARSKADKAEFIATFVGPPNPSRSWLGDARYARFLYQRDHVRDAQIKKRHRYVQSVTVAYAKEQLRMPNPSSDLIEVMRVKLLIKRDISSLTNVIKEIANA